MAEKCHAFAKALHYKELEYASSADTAVEALISINNQLRQPEAAIGILTLAQTQLHMELKVHLHMSCGTECYSSNARPGCCASQQGIGSSVGGQKEAGSQESWYEKLNRWDEALEAYERKYRNAHGTAAYVDAALGRLRLAACHLSSTSLDTAPIACPEPRLSCNQRCQALPPSAGACMHWQSGSG